MKSLPFVPRWQVHNLSGMERVLVPGGDGAQNAAELLARWIGSCWGSQVTLLQNDQTPTYAFTPA